LRTIESLEKERSDLQRELDNIHKKLDNQNKFAQEIESKLQSNEQNKN